MTIGTLIMIVTFWNTNPKGPILLLPDQSPQYINNSIQVFHTPDTLTGSQAYQAIISGYMPSHVNTLKSDASLKNNSFWLLFTLSNQAETSEIYYLNFAFNRTDSLQLFSIENDDQVMLLSKTGDAYPFDHRQVNYRSFIFPITLEASEEKTFLLNADKRGTVDRFPLRIMPAAKFDRLQNKENLQFGFYFGFFLLVSIVTLVIGVFFKRAIFSFYGLYTFFIGLYLFSSLGLAFQYLTPSFPEFNHYNLLIIGSWSVVFFSFYSLRYFKPHGEILWLDRVQRISTFALMVIVNIPSLLLTFVNETIYQWIIDHYMVVLMGNYLFVFVIFTLAIFRAIRFLSASGTIGWLFLGGVWCSFLGIIYSVLVDNAVFSDFIFNDNSSSVLVGFFGEFLFLSVAMAMILRGYLDDTRYRELHHRVKNNLQVISSMMSLQALQADNEEVKKIVQVGRERINAMVLIHQKLYMDESESLNAKEYIENLLEEIGKFYEQESKNVTLDANIEPLRLHPDTLSSIGMIINELVVNSYKYAFEGTGEPRINVALSSTGKSIQLEVADNGSGIPDGTSSEKKSFGLKLVQILTNQLKGELQISNNANGVKYLLTFKRMGN